jgi:simple sugar transport system substrate-binding protein
MTVRMRLLATLAAGATLLAACTAGGGTADNNDNANDNAAQNQSGIKVAVVSHGNAGDKFWDVVKSGAEQAGKDIGAQVTYQGNGDPNQQSQLIDAAVSQQVDGIVVSMANPDALREAIEKAVQAGIPVITINSGAEKSKEFGAITHIGQTESIAGQAAGERLKSEGATKLVCVIHEAGNVGLEERCAGAQQTFGGQVENLQVSVSDLSAAGSTIAAKLQSDSSVNGVLTLNNGVAMAAVQAAQTAGRTDLKIATFDLDAQVLDAIKGDQILFAIDQQPYLQGYLPVVFLSLYKSNANTVGGGQPVLTGPGFVDKENADQVSEFAGKGTR